VPALAETESLGADADADANANDPSAGLISAWEVLTCTVVACIHPSPRELPDAQAFGLAIS